VTERESLFTDAGVIEAQRLNLGRMPERKLRREWFLVTGFPERPPIRETYITQMRDEFARRGLAQPEETPRG
jgi:hypothetical protein